MGSGYQRQAGLREVHRQLAQSNGGKDQVYGQLGGCGVAFMEVLF